MYWVISLVFLLAGALSLFAVQVRRVIRRDTAWAWVSSQVAWRDLAFDEAMTRGMPAAAARLFRFAIQPGTPLRRVAEIRAICRVKARAVILHQVVAAPYGACWRFGGIFSGRFSALAAGRVDGAARLSGLFSRPARPATEHLFARLCVDALAWCPAAFLTSEFASWEPLDENRCRVRIAWHGFSQILDVTIDAQGTLGEIRILDQSGSGAIATTSPAEFRHMHGYLIPTRLRFTGTPGSMPPDIFADTALERITYRGPWIGSSHA
jgi:hypothetical protein